MPWFHLVQDRVARGRQLEALDAPVVRGRLPPDPTLALHAIEDVADGRSIEIDDLRGAGGVDAGRGADGDERGVLDGGEIAAACFEEVGGRDLVCAPDQVTRQPGERLSHLPAHCSGHGG